MLVADLGRAGPGWAWGDRRRLCWRSLLVLPRLSRIGFLTQWNGLEWQVRKSCKSCHEKVIWNKKIYQVLAGVRKSTAQLWSDSHGSAVKLVSRVCVLNLAGRLCLRTQGTTDRESLRMISVRFTVFPEILDQILLLACERFCGLTFVRLLMTNLLYLDFSTHA